MLRVAHYVERYPVPQHRYIYDQIIVSEDRRDCLLAEWGVDGDKMPNGAEVRAIRRLPRSSLGKGAVKVVNRTRDRISWGRDAAASAAFGATAVEDTAADLLHAHFGMAGARLARLGAEIPLVTTFYGVDASAVLRDPRWIPRVGALFANGAAFIVLSDRVVDRLVNAGAPRDRVHVWNIAIDLSRYPYRPPESRRGPPRILCAARFVEKKGHPVLLEAFRMLRRGQEAKLTLAGYGPLIDDVTRRVTEFGLTDDIEIVDTSRVENFDMLFSSLLAEHDVFALPSTVAADGDDEAGPALTVICAQASGLPVVVTAFPGAERSVAHRETGLVCEYDPAELCERLTELIEDSALAASLGHAASQHVRIEFGLERQLNALRDIYDQARRAGPSIRTESTAHS